MTLTSDPRIPWATESMRARARSMAGPTWASIRHGPASTTQPPSSTSGSWTTLTEASATRAWSSLGGDDVTRMQPDDEVLALRNQGHRPLDGLQGQRRAQAHLASEERFGQLEGQFDGFGFGLGHGFGTEGSGRGGRRR